MSHAESRLFSPLNVGKLKLSNRIAMAPLTRFRADKDHVPTAKVAKYYGQRASYPGTLLVTEATFISPKASGYPNAPGIWSPEQIAGWKEVVNAVHAEGSYIYLQLWHLGRASKSAELEKIGLDVVSASDIPIAEDGASKPRALTEEEIHTTIADYAQAAKNAVEGAGFDGVEIHGANGYLVDQFIQDVSNNRTDSWGGSIENRAKFPLAVAKAVVDAVGADKTGIRLSPWSNFQSMKMKEPIPQFTHVIKGLKELNLAYIHLTEARIDDADSKDSNDFAIDLWRGAKNSAVFIAGGFNPDTALEYVDKQHADADVGIVFGRHFISTPDIVYRIKHGLELNKYDRTTFYLPESEKGYVDYPFSDEFLKAKESSRL